MTLRTRFAAILGGSIFAAMMVVAVVAVLTLNNALRTGLDSHLMTTAHAIAVLVDVERGVPHLDGEDKRQAQIFLGSDMQGAIYDNAGHEVTALHRKPAPENLREPQDGGDDRVESAPDQRDVRVAIVPITYKGARYGIATVWGESEYIDQFVRNALATTFVVALLVGALAIALSSIVAARALAPLQRMADVAEEIEAHDLSLRLDGAGRDEVSRVARAFNRMLERLQAAFDRQKRFTADASHELRAPLAVIRAEAEVTLERDRAGSEYQRALTTISDEVQRADSVIASLLAAARAESGPPERTEVRAGELVERVAARFDPVARSRGLNIAIEGDLDATCRVDAAALDSALTAILHNATGAATSRVVLRVERAGSELACIVSDDGPGFTADALLHGTERFWRGGEARGRAGSGLGLAIADGVARAHGGRLLLRNDPGGGAVVSLICSAFM